MRLLKAITLCALLLSASIPAFAGELHPALAAEMDATPADQMVSAIVMMAEQAPIAQMNQDLKQERASMQRRHREVVLALQDVARGQAGLKTWLDARVAEGTVAGYSSHWIANLLVVQATPTVIEAISQREDVDMVEPNFTVSLIEPVKRPTLADPSETAIGDRGIGITPGLVAIGADRVWYELGIDGSGALVASCDTGVDGNHPALASRWRGTHAPASECWLDVLGSAPNFPEDDYGHGTHVTGTITGLAFDDSIGVAPGAEWIACNAIDQGVSSEFDNDVIVSYEWFADPDGNPGTTEDVPDVVQNSWRINEGFGGDYTDCDTRWWAVIDGAEAAGVVTTWSAGNEGPGGTTIGSPADRATTEYNCFSIGAVDATNDPTFPYNMASFSSRGPTGCDVPPALKIKPEVVAPGVDVYSSVPGGGYSGSYSGTSMSGPHVAGVVGLMRSANPDLDTDTVKLIIMQTARDQDGVGEDNTSGWGFVDAYAAVLGAMEGFGSLEGTVTNASWGDAPLQGATVELLGTSFDWQTDASGAYSGMAQADTYTARASRPGFASQDVAVVVNANEVTVQDFALTDIAGPTITNVTDFGFTSDAVGPYTIDADVEDPSTVGAVTLYYRINSGSWLTMAMSGGFGSYYADIPGAPANSQVDYYVHAADGNGLTSVEPAGAPLDFFSFFVTETFVFDDAEGGLGEWTVVNDASTTTGFWENADPVGTDYNGTTMQTEDDHTPNPGVLCFVTGASGGAAGDNDVDDGCTTLYSPVYDLSGADRAFVGYWRWYAEDGFSTDDDWVVEVNDGSGWTELERETGMANSWQRVALELGDFVALTSTVQFRFLACDLNSGGLVEAAVDDLGIDVLMTDLTSAPGDLPQQWSLQLLQSQPNPFHPGDGPVALRYSLSAAGPAKVQVFDIGGRLVRTLSDGAQAPGEHAVHWDGKDARGVTMSSGVYFYRLQAVGQSQSKSLVLIR